MRLLSQTCFLLLLGGALVLTGCDSTGINDPDDDPPPLIRVEDLPADPTTSSGGGPPTGTGRYTFFSLRDSSVVLIYSNETRADSNSTQWDLAVQSTNVIVNGGSNGPGQGAAYVAEAAFQDVTEANTDNLTSPSVEDWYNDNANGNHIVRPIPGRTIVVRTAEGEAYAKIRILSYYEGAPDDPAESDAESRYYTFEYILQTEGTSFE